MAYDLMAESPGAVNWAALRDALTYVSQGVEFFPVPAGRPEERDALGIRVPFTRLTAECWEELVGVVERLKGEYGMVVYEMHSGQELTGGSMDAAHANFASSAEVVYAAQKICADLNPTVMTLRR